MDDWCVHFLIKPTDGSDYGSFFAWFKSLSDIIVVSGGISPTFVMFPTTSLVKERLQNSLSVRIIFQF